MPIEPIPTDRSVVGFLLTIALVVGILIGISLSGWGMWEL